MAVTVHSTATDYEWNNKCVRLHRGGIRIGRIEVGFKMASQAGLLPLLTHRPVDMTHDQRMQLSMHLRQANEDRT